MDSRSKTDLSSPERSPQRAAPRVPDHAGHIITADSPEVQAIIQQHKQKWARESADTMRHVVNDLNETITSYKSQVHQLHSRLAEHTANSSHQTDMKDAVEALAAHVVDVEDPTPCHPQRPAPGAPDGLDSSMAFGSGMSLMMDLEAVGRKINALRHANRTSSAHAYVSSLPMYGEMTDYRLALRGYVRTVAEAVAALGVTANGGGDEGSAASCPLPASLDKLFEHEQLCGALQRAVDRHVAQETHSATTKHAVPKAAQSIRTSLNRLTVLMSELVPSSSGTPLSATVVSSHPADLLVETANAMQSAAQHMDSFIQTLLGDLRPMIRAACHGDDAAANGDDNTVLQCMMRLKFHLQRYEGSSAFAPAQRDSTSNEMFSLSRVVDILGGDADTCSASQLPTTAAQLALKLQTEKERAVRDCAVTAMGLHEMEARANELLRSHGIRNESVSASEILRKVRFVAAGSAPAASLDTMDTPSAGSSAIEAAISKMAELASIPPSTLIGDVSAKLLKCTSAVTDVVRTLHDDLRNANFAAGEGMAVAESLLGLEPAPKMSLMDRVRHLGDAHSAAGGSVVERLQTMIPMLPDACYATGQSSVDELLDSIQFALKMQHSTMKKQLLSPEVVEGCVHIIDTSLNGIDWFLGDLLRTVSGHADNADTRPQHEPSMVASTSLQEAVETLEERAKSIKESLATVGKSVTEVLGAAEQRIQRATTDVTTLLLPQQANTGALEDRVARVHDRIADLEAEYGKVRKANESLRSDRTRYDDLLRNRVMPLLNAFPDGGVSGVSPVRKVVKGKGPTNRSQSVDSSRVAAGDLAAYEAAVGELESLVNQTVSQAQAVSSRLDNLDTFNKTTQKNYKKLRDDVEAMCHALNVDVDANISNTLQKLRAHFTTEGASGEAAGAQTQIELERVKAELDERNQSITDYKELCAELLSHVSSLNRSLQRITLGFVVVDDDGSVPGESGDLIAEITAAEKSVDHLDALTTEHVQCLSKVAKYLSTVCHEITGRIGEVHDGTVTDLQSTLLRFADDILIGCRQLKGVEAAPGSPARDPADHRLLRLSEATSRINSVLVTLGEVRYLSLQPAHKPLFEDADASFAQDKEATVHDDVIRSLERKMAIAERRLKRFSDDYKGAAIVVERDQERHAADADVMLDALQMIKVEQLRMEREELTNLQNDLRRKAQYFADGHSASNPSVLGQALHHVAYALPRIVEGWLQGRTKYMDVKERLQTIEAAVEPFLDTKENETLEQCVDRLCLSATKLGTAQAEVDRLTHEVEELVETNETMKTEVDATKAHIGSEVDALREAILKLTEERDTYQSAAAIARTKCTRAEAQRDEAMDRLGTVKENHRPPSPPRAAAMKTGYARPQSPPQRPHDSARRSMALEDVLSAVTSSQRPSHYTPSPTAEATASSRRYPSPGRGAGRHNITVRTPSHRAASPGAYFAGGGSSSWVDVGARGAAPNAYPTVSPPRNRVTVVPSQRGSSSSVAKKRPMKF